MKEVEVKAKVENLDAIKRRFVEMGCEFSEPIQQDDMIFLHTSVEFETIVRGSVIMRIRDANGKIMLNLKKQLENEFDNIEREFEISDAQEAKEMLECMDYTERVKVSKKRVKTKYKDMTICFDEVEHLGSYIEVEKLMKDGDSVKTQEELFAFLEQFGISKDDRVLIGYDTEIHNLQK